MNHGIQHGNTLCHKHLHRSTDFGLWFKACVIDNLTSLVIETGCYEVIDMLTKMTILDCKHLHREKEYAKIKD